MTADELRRALHDARHPATFEVDRETYEAAEEAILDWVDAAPLSEGRSVWMGPNGGIMFENVELIRR